MSRIVGIDLGTTNSLVAYVEGGVPRVIRDPEGRALLPSIVAYTPDGILVGEPARRQLVRNPARTIYSVKRFMGRGYEDIQDELCHCPFEFLASADVLRIKVGDSAVTPPEVSAHVLRALRQRAEAFFGEPVEQAVITVPAYFNDSQRQATKDAGRVAGLDVLRIVNEPTAASLAYGLQKLAQGTIAVYDLGGGTFDVSILSVKDGIFEVLATHGNTHLGGDDFDRVLVEWLLADIRETHRVDLSKDPEARQELRLGAEAAKCRLSFDDRTLLTLPFEGFTYPRALTRAEVEGLIGPLVEATLGPCRMALKDAGLTPDRIDEVVALGAAVQAQILAGGITDMLLLDVTPLSLGLETLGGVVSVLIPRNTTIPTMAKELFTTSVDGQGAVDLHVLQGERELARDNRSLARFELSGVDPMPAGMPKIEVTFLIDANGILQVRARELRTGKEASIEVRPTYGLTEAEVARMVEESFEHAEEDVNARLLIETRTEADTVMTHVERALAQGAGLVSAGELAGIRGALQALREVRSGQDRDLIRERTIEVNKATERLAEAMMDAALKGALSSRRADEILGPK